jgi:hypothetical protein
MMNSTTRPTLAGVCDKMEIGVELNSLTNLEIDVLIAGLQQMKAGRFNPHGRRPFGYFSVYSDAGHLREALVEDLVAWITAGFVNPNYAERWHAGVRRLAALIATSRPVLIDQLYADAALVLGLEDDSPEALVRVSELS